MATSYAPYNPTGATRTVKYGLIRPIPLEPDWHNHQWFERYQMDFVNKNIAENNGMISGGSISGDAVDIITPVGGVAYINGNEVTVATPGTHQVTADGWTIVYITSAGAFVYGALVNSTVQAAIAPSDAVAVGYAVKGDGIFTVFSFANVIINSEVDGETQHIQPDVTVGPLLTDPRATNLETTFIASLSAGDKLLFLTGVTFTAARDISSVGQVELWMDGPAIKVNIDTFDLTLGDCSGYLGVTSSGGKVILDGLCRNLIIDGNVNIEKGSNFRGNYLTRGIAVGQNAEHIWGTSTQVTAGTATFYTDGSGNPLDKDAAAVVINDDDKILIAHDVTQTANLLLDAGGKKITLKMLAGVTLDMDMFDLTLGGTGDSIGGDIRITQTGSLVISGNRGLSINNSADVYSDWKRKNLVVAVASVTTVDADADNIILVDEFGGGERINNLNETFDITSSDRYNHPSSSEKSSTDYELWVSSDGFGIVTKTMVPNIVGITDSTTASKLKDSTGDFINDLIPIGSIVKNTDDDTQTTVTGTDDAGTLSLTDDIFVSGENYEINIISPTGLDKKRANIGRATNNSSGDIDSATEYSSPRITTARYSDQNGKSINNTFVVDYGVEDLAPDNYVAAVKTLAQQVNDGLLITVKRKCKVEINIGHDYGTGTGYFGVSINASGAELDASILALASNKILGRVDSTLINNVNPMTAIGTFKEGDVLAIHGDGNSDGTQAVNGYCHITATEIK